MAPTTNDRQATACIDPTSGGFKPPSNIQFQASFTNNGTATQTNVPVRYQVTNGSGSLLYQSDKTIASIASGVTVTVIFDVGGFGSPNTYNIYAESMLPGDQ